MNKSNLPPFLIGVLVTLFIFGFNTPLLKYFQIKYTLPGSHAEWLGILGTLTASITALAIAIWGERLKNWGGYKPVIVLIDKFENTQENEAHQKQGHTRLVFENIGRGTAEEVEAYVTKIYDNNNERRNFLPVPLSWTHDGRSVRNFHVNQFRYLDFCRIDNIEDKKFTPNLVLVAGAGIPAYQKIEVSTNRIELTLFQKSQQKGKYEIDVEWEHDYPWVKVVSFKKV